MVEASEALTREGVPNPLAEGQPKGYDAKKSRELVGERRADAKVFENPDGTRTAKFYPRPVHYRDSSGRWAEIDTKLSNSNGRWRSGAGTLPTELASKATDSRLVSVELGPERRLAWSLAGAKPATGAASRSALTYRRALPGVDVEIAATASGVKETLVLSDRNAPDRYVFPLELTGVTARLADDGSVRIVPNQKGAEPVAVIPPGFMEDSRLAEGVGDVSLGVTYELLESGGVTELVVRLDRKWLDDPARVFPVKVDPTVQGWNAYVDDTYLVNGLTDNFANTGELRIGRHPVNGVDRTADAFLRFDIGSVLNPPDMQILNAELKLYDVWSGTWGTNGCNDRGVGVYKVTEPWAGTVSVYPGPAYDSTKKDWKAYAKGGHSSCPAGWVEYGAAYGTGPNLRQWVEDWADDPASNDGLTVRVDPGSEWDSEAFKIFSSSQGANPPVLFVEYSPYQAEIVSIADQFTTSPGPNTWGSIPVTVKNTGHDTWPAGGSVRLSYHLYKVDGTLVDWDGARTTLPSAVPPGASVNLVAQVEPTPTVDWYTFVFDMVADGVDWFSTVGSPTKHKTLPAAGATIQINSASPADLTRLGTNQVALSVSATDPEGAPLTYKFEICGAAPGDCQSSATQSTPSWGTPVEWGRSYTWNVAVSDGLSVTRLAQGLRVDVYIPQPTGRLGADTYSPLVGGVNPATGNFVFSNTDLALGGLSFAEVTRTYNSQSTRIGSFGPGWSAPWDVSRTSDGTQALVTWADGRQERFGRNPDWRIVDGNGYAQDGGVYTSPPGSAMEAYGGGAYGYFRVGPRSGIGDKYWFGINPGPDMITTNNITNPYTTTFTYSNGKPTSFSNGAGRTVTLTWTGDRVTKVEGPAVAAPAVRVVWTYGYDTRPDASVLTPFSTTAYNPAGLPSSTTDTRGQTTTYAYDSFGQLTARTDPAAGGQPAGVWRYTYDDAGRIRSTAAPNGALTETTYDDRDRVGTDKATERYPSTAVLTTSYGYDDLGPMIRMTTPTGAVTTTTINAAGEPVSITDAAGKTSTVAYDAAGRSVLTTDPLGRGTRSTYDKAGRLSSLANLAPGGAQLRQETYGSDKAGNQTSATSPLGWTTSFAYDAAGRLTSQVEPVSASAAITTTFGYDKAGNRTRTTDGNNHSTITTYNPWGLPASVVEPPTTAHPAVGERTYTATYDAAGNAVRLDAPGGVSRTRTHDELGRLSAETGAGAEATTADRTLGYDLLGRVTSASTPSGSQTFSWDDRSNLTASTGPLGASAFTYDPDGRMTARTDAAGTSAFTWDPRGVMATATDPLTGATRTFAYDNGAQLTGIDYGTGKAKQGFAYDDLGRLTSDTLSTAASAVLASTARTYDAADQLRTKTVGPAGVAGAGAHTYDYDRAGRLTSWTAPGGAQTTYAFDGAGNRTQAGTSFFTYDERNRLLSEATAVAGPVFSENWTGADNANWEPTRWTAPSTTSSRDVDLSGGEGRIYVSSTSAEALAITGPLADADVTLTYRFSSRSAASVLRLGLRVTDTPSSSSYRVDIQSNSSTVKVQKRLPGQSATEINRFTYNTDAAPQKVRFQVQGSTLRVKIWAATATEPTTWNFETTDTAITSAGVVMVGHSSQSASNTLYVDNLELRNLNAAPGAPVATYTWTPRGTLASKTPAGQAAQTSVFDAFDRLVSDAGGSYSYDAFDRLAARGANSFRYAGVEKEPVADGGQLFARTPNGSPLAVGKGTTKLALLGDALHGDVVGTFDPAGTALADTSAYDPYGNRIASSGTTGAALGFQGQWTDNATGKVTMQARAYDPAMGGFVSRDSWTNPPLPSAGMNRYGYGNASPLNYGDTNGHLAFLVPFIPLLVDAVVGLVVVGGATIAVDQADKSSGGPGLVARGDVVIDGLSNGLGNASRSFTGGYGGGGSMTATPPAIRPAPASGGAVGGSILGSVLGPVSTLLNQQHAGTVTHNPGTQTDLSVRRQPVPRPTTAKPNTQKNTAPRHRAPKQPAQKPIDIEPAPPKPPANVELGQLQPGPPPTPPSLTPAPSSTEVLDRSTFDGIGKVIEDTVTLKVADRISDDNGQKDEERPKIPGPGPCPTGSNGIPGRCLPQKPDECTNPAPQTALEQPCKGMLVYRVYGEGFGNGEFGSSWTPVDPRSIGPDRYRDLAGLPDSNPGSHLVIGELIDPSAAVAVRPALPCGPPHCANDRPGGLIEYIIPSNPLAVVNRTYASLSPRY